MKIPQGLIGLVDSGLLDIKSLDSFKEKKKDIIFDLPETKEPIVEELDTDDEEIGKLDDTEIPFPHNHWIHQQYPGMYKIIPIKTMFVCEECHFFGCILSTQETCPNCLRKILFDGERMRLENA